MWNIFKIESIKTQAVLNKFQRMSVIYMFFDHSIIKLKIL